MGKVTQLLRSLRQNVIEAHLLLCVMMTVMAKNRAFEKKHDTWRLNPFRTAVPFWGQTTSSLTGLSPKRDCGSKRVINPFNLGLRSVPFWARTISDLTGLCPKTGRQP